MNAITVRHRLDIIYRSTSDTAARSLELLEDIEQTIDSLRWIADRAAADTAFLQSGAEEIKAATPSTWLDSDGERCKSLEQVQESIKRAYGVFVGKRDAAIDTPELAPDDGVVEAYTEVMNSLDDLHDALEELRWTVMMHDSQMDKPTGKPYISVDAMMADLLK